jgi:thiamine pyrophosphate-dependent acetolactate synthase large subunit-like protein
MVRLDRVLPRERLVVVDPGHQCSFTAGYLHVQHPDCFAFPSEAGSIGVALGEAIGAAFARPGTVAVAGVGDAGLMMALAEIDTAVRYRVPVVIVCCNDMALGAEVHFMDVLGVPSALAKLATPSLAAVAQAMGAEGYTVKSVDDFAALEERFEKPVEGPIMIEFLVNGEVRAEWVESQIRNSTPPPILPMEGEEALLVQ